MRPLLYSHLMKCHSVSTVVRVKQKLLPQKFQTFSENVIRLSVNFGKMSVILIWISTRQFSSHACCKLIFQRRQVLVSTEFEVQYASSRSGTVLDHQSNCKFVSSYTVRWIIVYRFKYGENSSIWLADNQYIHLRGDRRRKRESFPALQCIWEIY